MNTFKLLNKIIACGGVIGNSAKLYATNLKLAHAYIMEWEVNISQTTLQNLWGPSLVNQVKHYIEMHKLKQKPV